MLMPAIRAIIRPQTFLSTRSEEHTSELQSRSDLVCRLLLEKKKNPREFVRNALGPEYGRIRGALPACRSQPSADVRPPRHVVPRTRVQPTPNAAAHRMAMPGRAA